MEEPGIIAWTIGGLGNQMFIVAAAWLCATYHKCPLYMLTNTGNKHNKEGHDYRETIFSRFGTQIHDRELTQQTLQILCASGWSLAHQGKPAFAPYSYLDTPPPCIYMFYYQFFPPIEEKEEELRTLFCEGLAPLCERLRSVVTDPSRTAFLHVRRGDYLQYSTIHPLVPSSYYEEALRQCDAEKVLVFSDDPAWVKEQPWAHTDRLQILEGYNELETMALMTLCEGGAICANSSFSWWGAFLGPHRVRAPVFVPSVWILTEQVVCLFPEEWRAL